MQESIALNNLEKSAPEETAAEQNVAKNFNRPAKPISELVATDDFPRCALGEFVDIGGFTGIVMEIVKQSLKVTSQEGDTVSYNANGLRKIYAPKLQSQTVVNVARQASTPHEVASEKHSEPAREISQTSAPAQEVQSAVPEELPAPKANVIHELDFNRPAKPIIEFAGRADFPQCTLGEFLNIGGYAGVVVEIVKRSLKVQSQEGRTMSYNANGLRKLYAPKITAAFPDPHMPMRSISLEEPIKKMEVAPEPKPVVELDFTQPIKVIRVFAVRRDFPECALGQLVDVRGFSGIVVQIAGDSLEVRAEDGTIRSYDIEGLRKIFGRG